MCKVRAKSHLLLVSQIQPGIRKDIISVSNGQIYYQQTDLPGNIRKNKKSQINVALKFSPMERIQINGAHRFY